MDDRTWPRFLLDEDVEALQQLKQHHVHLPKKTGGPRLPLDHCRDKKDLTKCKAGFPREPQLIETTTLVWRCCRTRPCRACRNSRSGGTSGSSGRRRGAGAPAAPGCGPVRRGWLQTPGRGWGRIAGRGPGAASPCCLARTGRRSRRAGCRGRSDWRGFGGAWSCAPRGCPGCSGCAPRCCPRPVALWLLLHQGFCGEPYYAFLLRLSRTRCMPCYVILTAVVGSQARSPMRAVSWLFRLSGGVFLFRAPSRRPASVRRRSAPCSGLR